MTRKAKPTRRSRKAVKAAAPLAAFPTLQSLAEPFIDAAARRMEGNLASAGQAWDEGVALLRSILSNSPSSAAAAAREAASATVAYARNKPWHTASMLLLAGATLAAGRAAALDQAR
jgi:hypothetical protein